MFAFIPANNNYHIYNLRVSVFIYNYNVPTLPKADSHWAAYVINNTIKLRVNVTLRQFAPILCKTVVSKYKI